MADYEPLDLISYCNATASFYGESRSPKTGEQTFRGIPFKIGSEHGENCFIGFGAGEGLCRTPVHIAVGRAARHVIFAHALRESYLHSGEAVGRVIARYIFRLAGQAPLEAVIRERFEIGAVPVGWGEFPFLAVPDASEGINSARYEGLWGAAGQRQCEADQAWPRDYYLWAWQNPHPEAAIESIEVLPGDGSEIRRFLIAAITLGHADEQPFHREAGVPVKLTLLEEADARAPFNLEVTVDRGVATYPYALPAEPTERFLQDSHAGFGQEVNQAGSPAYVEIAASPSATVTVSSDGGELARATWGNLRSETRVDTARVRFEVLDTGRNWVHTSVLDDATGKPIPCRVHFRSPDGVPWQPHGHHSHIHSDLGTWHFDIGGDLRLGQATYAYIDGKCQGWLPRGQLIVDVARGFEYEPLRAAVEIKPGQRELSLRLKRHSNLNADRYFSGDTHVHFLSTQGALTEAAAEDLDVVNLLLSQWGHLYTNSEEFTGQPVTSGDRETIVYATQENRQHLLGHLTLLGLKEPVMPWCSDGPSEAELGGNLEVTMSHWADACHAQGGTVIIPHLPNPNGEPAALIATGRADAVEFLVHNPFFHLEYYRYLNGGYRLPLVGGTDKMDSGVPVGLYRTYAYIPPDEAFTYDNWCKALRSGNTFLSGGPLLRFTVDGQPMGSTLSLSRGGGTVEVEASARSIFPVHTLEIVQGGRIVASTEQEEGRKTLSLRATLKIDRSTWLCARCAGPGYTSISHHDSWRRGIMAHTSPVYIACGGGYDLFEPQTATYMLTLLDGSLQHIRSRAPQWRPGTVTHHHGEEDHQAFLERPFHEAVAAVHRKLHEHGIAH